MSIDAASRKRGITVKTLREAEGTLPDGTQVELDLKQYNDGTLQMNADLKRYDPEYWASSDDSYPENLAEAHREFDAQVKKYNLVEKKKETEGT